MPQKPSYVVYIHFIDFITSTYVKLYPVSRVHFFKSLAHTANVLCSDSNLLKGSLMRDLNLSALTLITSCANVILFCFRYSSCHKYPTKSPFLILLGFVSTPRSHYATSPNVTHYRDNQKTAEPNGTTLLTYIWSLC